MDLSKCSEIIYRIAWHISDPTTWLNFSLVCKVCRDACKHWEKPKMTEFSRRVYPNLIALAILPNGEFHGPGMFEHPGDGGYFYRGIRIGMTNSQAYPNDAYTAIWKSMEISYYDPIKTLTVTDLNDISRWVQIFIRDGTIIVNSNYCREV